jgi:hypothetical protein
VKPFKACHCRDPETGKLLGKTCPDLTKRRHGAWYGRYEAPRGEDGKRRQPRIGPYATEKECKDELAKAAGQAGQISHVDRKIKVGAYLAKRLAWRESEAASGDGLKPSTLEAEHEAISLYFRPGPV